MVDQVARYKMFDRAGKGEITENEFKQLQKAGKFSPEIQGSFDHYDRNKDGVINMADAEGRSKSSSSHPKSNPPSPKSGSRPDPIQGGGKPSDGGSNVIGGGNVKPNSSGKVIMQFGWSDTNSSEIRNALKNAGIDSGSYKYKTMADEHDKNIGIAVVTPEQAAKFKKYTDSHDHVFSNVQAADNRVSSMKHLSVHFGTPSDTKDSTDASGKHDHKGTFGGGDYSGVITDDPSQITSGKNNTIGKQKGDDALWSHHGGGTVEFQMIKEIHGQQYITMKADII